MAAPRDAKATAAGIEPRQLADLISIGPAMLREFRVAGDSQPWRKLGAGKNPASGCMKKLGRVARAAPGHLRAGYFFAPAVEQARRIRGCRRKKCQWVVLEREAERRERNEERD